MAKNSTVSLLLTPAQCTFTCGDIRLKHVGPSFTLLIPHIVDFVLPMAPRWLIVSVAVTPNYTYPIATIGPRLTPHN